MYNCNVMFVFLNLGNLFLLRHCLENKMRKKMEASLSYKFDLIRLVLERRFDQNMSKRKSSQLFL